jgi:hypothetical protein
VSTQGEDEPQPEGCSLRLRRALGECRRALRGLQLQIDELSRQNAALRKKVSELSETKTSDGGSGFYLGLVGGVGPTEILQSDDAEPEYAILFPGYEPIVGGRIMGVSDSGFAAGLTVMSNSSFMADISFRVK